MLMAKNVAGRPPPLCILNHPFRPFRKLQEPVHSVRQSHMPFLCKYKSFFKMGFQKNLTYIVNAPPFFLIKAILKIPKH